MDRNGTRSAFLGNTVKGAVIKTVIVGGTLVKRENPAEREAFLAGGETPPTTETVTEGGISVDLRAISYGKRTRIFERLGIEGGQIEKLPLGVLYRLKLEAVIACAYAEGDTNPLFVEADRDELAAQDAGGFIDQIGDAALGMLFGERSSEDAKKSLKTTSSDASSSPSLSVGDKTPSTSPSATPSMN
jgi:hypothetical protein